MLRHVNKKLKRLRGGLTGWFVKLVMFGILPLSIHAQTIPSDAGLTPTRQGADIVVTQAWVDDANRAFEEVLKLREAVESLQVSERQSREKLQEELEGTIASLQRLIAIQDRTILAYENYTTTVTKLYESLIRVQQTIIDKLTDTILNPKRDSKLVKLFKGVFKVVEKAVLVLSGVGIGKAIGG